MTNREVRGEIIYLLLCEKMQLKLESEEIQPVVQVKNLPWFGKVYIDLKCDWKLKASVSCKLWRILRSDLLQNMSDKWQKWMHLVVILKTGGSYILRTRVQAEVKCTKMYVYSRD